MAVEAALGSARHGRWELKFRISRISTSDLARSRGEAQIRREEEEARQLQDSGKVVGFRSLLRRKRVWKLYFGGH